MDKKTFPAMLVNGIIGSVLFCVVGLFTGHIIILAFLGFIFGALIGYIHVN